MNGSSDTAGSEERVRERGVLRLQPGVFAAGDRTCAGGSDQPSGREARGGLRPGSDWFRDEAGAPGARAGRDHRVQGAVSGVIFSVDAYGKSVVAEGRDSVFVSPFAHCTHVYVRSIGLAPSSGGTLRLHVTGR